MLEVIAPGLLVVKHSRGGESEKFVNIAVLQGDEIKMVDEEAARLPDCPDLLTSLLGFDTQQASTESVSLLIRLAVSMRTHGRGGSLLVVPAKTDGLARVAGAAGPVRARPAVLGARGADAGPSCRRARIAAGRMRSTARSTESPA